MDYTALEILQARILEWVAFPFSRGSSHPRDKTLVSHIAGGFFTSWATREAKKVGGCCQKVAKFILSTVESDVNWSLVLPRVPEHSKSIWRLQRTRIEPEGVAREADQRTLRGPGRNMHGSAIFLREAMAPYSSTLARKIPWMEKPDRLRSMGSRRVGHDWAT